MNKMNNKDLFAKVLENLEGEVKDQFNEFVAKYNEKGVKAGIRRAEKLAEVNAPLIEDLHKVLSTEPQTLDEIMSKLSVKVVANKPVSNQKLIALLKDFDGIVKGSVRIGEGKERKERTTYAIAE